MPAANPTAAAPTVLTVPQDGDHTGGRAEGRRLAVAHLLHREPAEHAEAAGNQRVQEDRGGRAVGRQCRPRIESEPPEPQQSDPEQHERQIVRAHRVLLEPDARPQHQREQCLHRTTRFVERGA